MSRVIKQSKQHSRLILEELEPRRLFSGGIEGLAPSSAEYLTGPILRDLNAHRPENDDSASAITAAEQRSREIVFVDAAVENYQQFVDDLTNSADTDRDFEVVVLERDKDGIEQISSLLQQYQDVDAVHIISHGNDGNIQLGNTSLNADTLQQNSASIALWANAFTDSGDILIYGCDLAASEIGQNLINELGALTLTDVAASDDLTGAEKQGGDWVLEYKAGKIESTVAVSADLQQAYRSTLATTAEDDSYSVGEDSDLSVAANGVMANDNLPDQAVTVTSVNGSTPDVNGEILLPSGALLTLNDDGSFTYKTNGAFENLGPSGGGSPTSATDTFTYESKAATGPSSGPATVTITINGVDDAAIVSGDTSYSGNEGDVVGGDMDASDVEGLADSTYFTVTGDPANGVAAIDPATGVWTFTPTDPNWIGTDQFTVTITDDKGGTTDQLVNITLANVDDDPATIGGNISYTGDEGDAVTGTMTASDPEGVIDGTVFSVTSNATNGTAAIDPASGAWTFTPTDINWFGSDSFTVTVTDDLDGTVTQVVSITLAPVNDAPVITDGPDTAGLIETNAGLSTSGDLTIGDVDISDAVTASIDSLVVSGTSNRLDPAAPSDAALLAMFSINPTAILDGTEITDTLDWTFISGAETFDYLAAGETLILEYTVKATDDDATPLNDTETVTITITGSNDDPVFSIVDVVGDITEGATLTDSGSITFADLDGSDTPTATEATQSVTTALTLTLAQQAAIEDAFTISADAGNTNDGTIDWDYTIAEADLDFLATGETVTVVYTITADDGNLGTDTQNVTINITGSNDAPVITIGAGSAAETLIETNTGLTVADTLTVTDIDTTNTVTSDVISVVESGDVSGIANATLLAMMGVTGDLTWSRAVTSPVSPTPPCSR